VGIQGHTVPVETLLERIGIPQSPQPAYLRDDAEIATAVNLRAAGSLVR
jgi:hypothetical protein